MIIEKADRKANNLFEFSPLKVTSSGPMTMYEFSSEQLISLPYLYFP